jgi:hypothetical protein
MERFTSDPGDGPMKTTTLRGIKESPARLNDQEKKDLVAFMRALKQERCG